MNPPVVSHFLRNAQENTANSARRGTVSPGSCMRRYEAVLTLREIEERVLANGRVDGHDLEVLRRVLYADGKIDRKEADFLVELHKRARDRSPAFEQFFYQAVKEHILADGKIGPKKTAWLQQMLFADGK